MRNTLVSFVSDTGTCFKRIKLQFLQMVMSFRCLDVEGIIKLGNLFEEPTAILAKTVFRMKGFENRKIVEELCKKCSYRLRFEKK